MRKKNLSGEEMRERIESLKSEAGGWTRASLKKLGVRWPPRRGWKARLIEEAFWNESEVPSPKIIRGLKDPPFDYSEETAVPPEVIERHRRWEEANQWVPRVDG